MDLTALIVFYVFLVLVVAKARRTQFARYLPLEDRNMTTNILASSLTQHIGGCASSCGGTDNCSSFIFNPETKECQLHNVVFTSADNGAKYQKGLQYYYNTLQQTTTITDVETWCPVDDGYWLLDVDGPCVKHEVSRPCSAKSRPVVLDTQKKNQLVKYWTTDIATLIGISYPVIGLSEHDDGIYRWVNGANVSFTDWSISYFTSSKGESECVVLDKHDNWTWTHFSCDSITERICEIV